MYILYNSTASEGKCQVLGIYAITWKKLIMNFCRFETDIKMLEGKKMMLRKGTHEKTGSLNCQKLSSEGVFLTCIRH